MRGKGSRRRVWFLWPPRITCTFGDLDSGEGIYINDLSGLCIAHDYVHIRLRNLYHSR